MPAPRWPSRPRRPHLGAPASARRLAPEAARPRLRTGPQLSHRAWSAVPRATGVARRPARRSRAGPWPRPAGWRRSWGLDRVPLLQSQEFLWHPSCHQSRSTDDGNCLTLGLSRASLQSPRQAPGTARVPVRTTAPPGGAPSLEGSRGARSERGQIDEAGACHAARTEAGHRPVDPLTLGVLFCWQ